ncbi:MAG: hypothetical protein WBM17_17580 [Anaerolineales bacterium]
MAKTIPPIAALVIEVDPSTDQVKRSYWENYEDAVERWFRQQDLAAPKSLISDTEFKAELET